ncbi:MAG TPA: GH25 family lysozyme [Methylovirgula sp.]|nr:GH25 family lysozyme [Methylovirgula sp.]
MLSPAFLVLALCLSLLLSACATGGMTDVYPSPEDFEVHGIDVSKYQGDIDWNAVRTAGVKFAWIKATEGGDVVDEKFNQNWEEAKAAGVPRGAYHFAYWCRSGTEQASWFVANVPNDPSALPPVLDVEWNSHSKTCPRHISREEALATIQTILDAMQRTYGKRPIIYTSIDFYHDVLEGNITGYPMWVRSVKDYPAVKYGTLKWDFWQHTAQGQVPGIRGYVDRNAFYGSAKDWQTWLTAEAATE